MLVCLSVHSFDAINILKCFNFMILIQNFKQTVDKIKKLVITRFTPTKKLSP